MICWIPAAALAGGFQVPTQSASAGGQGDAFTAKADDASAVYYNPAGLTQVPGDQVSAGLYAVFPDFKFEGSGGDEHSTESAYLPHLYAATDAGQDRWRFGLGMNYVFGLREDWGDNGQLSSIITHGELSVLNIAPTIAYRVNDQFSLAGSANIYHGDVELNNRVPFAGGGEGNLRVSGDGEAIGGTFGGLWKITPKHAVGLVYRGPFSIDFDGETELASAGPNIGPSDSSARIDFPQIVVAGYAFRPTGNWTLTADIQWADWETLDSVSLKSDNPAFASLPPRVFDYRSSFTYRAGLAYQFERDWFLRTGYVYSTTSSPEDTFTPAVVDLNSHIFTMGLGYHRSRWGLDLAYRFIYGPERSIDQSANSPPGDYSDITHAVIATLSWHR